MLWCRPLRATAAAVAAITPWLSDQERLRAARFGTSALRERYIMGRATLRLLLSNVLGVHPAAVAIARGARGRPELSTTPRIDFNVSHTDEFAVYAIGHGLPAAVRIGVDVEHAARTLGVDRLSRKLLTEDERARMHGLDADARRGRFLRTWTCKEAMSKATGDGIAAPFGRISVEPDEPPRVLDGPSPYDPARWELHRVPAPDGYIVTVALHQT